jgi:hypothetical protein
MPKPLTDWTKVKDSSPQGGRETNECSIADVKLKREHCAKHPYKGGKKGHDRKGTQQVHEEMAPMVQIRLASTARLHLRRPCLMCSSCIAGIERAQQREAPEIIPAILNPSDEPFVPSDRLQQIIVASVQRF